MGGAFCKSGLTPTKWNETESNFAFYFTFYLFGGGGAYAPNAPPRLWAWIPSSTPVKRFFSFGELFIQQKETE